MLKKKKHQSKSHDPLHSEKPKKNAAFSPADEETADARYDNTDVTLDELINSVRDSSDADADTADNAASAENEDLETLREEAEEMIERLTEEEAEEHRNAGDAEPTDAVTGFTVPDADDSRDSVKSEYEISADHRAETDETESAYAPSDASEDVSAEDSSANGGSSADGMVWIASDESSGNISDTPDESAHGDLAEAITVTDTDGEKIAQTAEIADEKAFADSDSPSAAEKSDPENADAVFSEDVQAEEVQDNIPDAMPENEEPPEGALPEKTDDTAACETNKNKKTPVAKIIASLTVICAVIAAMLAAVNAFTADRIAKNTELEKENSIRKIFGSYITAEEYTDFESQEEMYVYLVYKSNMLYGYCVNVFPSGFGGQINMMVGVGADSAVAGVNIVSMSETPGLGSKTNTRDFLSGYEGKKGKVTLGADIDAVSGATISSKAVTAGVNSALALDIDLAAIADEKGVMLYVSELDTDPPETDGDGGDAPIYQPNQRPNIQSGRVEDTLDYVDGVENPNAAPSAERPTIDIPVQSDTEVYITETETETGDDTDLTPAPPETTTSTPETTTKAPETTTKAPETTAKAPETTTKAPETTTTKEPETTTQTPPETEPKQEETTGSAGENEDPV